MARIISVAALGLLLLLGVGGCGSGKPKPVPVEGVVTLDGVPVVDAVVAFTPASGEGPSASGRTGSDGVFHLTTYTSGDGAVPGDYKVTITKTQSVAPSSNTDVQSLPQSERAQAMTKMMAAASKGARPPSQQKHTSELPAIYSDVSRSGLRARVPPEGRIKFELHKSGGT